MSAVVVYPPFGADAVDLSPMDPDASPTIGVDWSKWLESKDIQNVDESTWDVPAGVVIGDGFTPVDIKGKTIVPAAPTVVPGRHDPTRIGLTLVTIYLDQVTPPVGNVLLIENHIRAGQVVDERTIRIRIAER